MPNVLVPVGNDVVDLRAPRTRGKAADTRFVSRVFCEEERELIASSPDPDREVWLLWAAKETCYKVATKLRTEPPAFVHASFVVQWDSDVDLASPTRAGTVRWEDVTCPVAVSSDADAVHAVGYAGGPHRSFETIGLGAGCEALDAMDAPWSGSERDLRDRLTPREEASVHSRASAAVRLGARAAVANALGIEPARIEIVADPGAVGRRPPRFLVDGAEGFADVSLSHDGAWIAWAWTAGRSREGVPRG